MLARTGVLGALWLEEEPRLDQGVRTRMTAQKGIRGFACVQNRSGMRMQFKGAQLKKAKLSAPGDEGTTK